jgi:hypothetical protein
MAAEHLVLGLTGVTPVTSKLGMTEATLAKIKHPITALTPDQSSLLLRVAAAAGRRRHRVRPHFDD